MLTDLTELKELYDMGCMGKNALADAFEDKKKVELLDERDQAREREELAARDRPELNAIGLIRQGVRVAS